jgi:hypothetical protein
MLRKNKLNFPIIRAGIAARRQWEIYAVLAGLALCLFTWFVCVPVARKTIFDIRQVQREYVFVNKVDSIITLTRNARVRADNLDSILKTTPVQEAFNEQSVPGMMYEFAHKAGVKASKVAIGGKNNTKDGVTLPVTFEGEGTFDECGQFIDFIENVNPACRIRVLNMRNSARGKIYLFLDFLLIAQK